MQAQPLAWQFWIDRGGTFTDIVAVAPDGSLRTKKLLSENPAHYADAALAGIREFLASSSPEQRLIGSVRIGTTIATNALLERSGTPTVFVTTAGFGDVLRIGSQQRPDIFALAVKLPDMLYGIVVEADERISASGEVLVPLDEARLEEDLRRARSGGYASVAITFLHAYRFPEHERRAAELAARAGFTHIAVSHEVSPLIKLVERGDTTVVDAYLTPVLQTYVARVRAGLSPELDDARLLFMQSHGGLVGARAFRGRDSIFSGPAGGAVGMTEAALASGFERVIGFDMGGTSTDVCIYSGGFERISATTVGGVRVAAPMLRINTVAAGGGSILKYAGGRLQVGPESAGAQPGPACYRNGGPLTVTDANVLLGRVQADFFPCVFGLSGAAPIDTEIVTTRFATLAAEVGADAKQPPDAAALAAGYLRIAVERMANAIKQVSVQRGHDVREFTLSCFGGAGGQHACQVADALGIDRVLIDPLAGVLSAYGIGVADVRSIRSAAVQRLLDDACVEALATRSAQLVEELRSDLHVHAGSAERLAFEFRANLRVRGSDTSLPMAYVPGMRPAELAARFAERHEQLFGFGASAAALEVELLEVEAVAVMRRPLRPTLAEATHPARPRRSGACGLPDSGRTRPSIGAHRSMWAIAWRALRSSPRRTRPRSSSPNGAPSSMRTACSFSHAAKRVASASSPARAAIRSCSRCSTTSSCTSPSRWAWSSSKRPTQSTSRSASITRARFSMRPVISSRMPRTSPCTWARWATACAPCSALSRPECAPATHSC
jgi:5-oxoprolinase (ATP-hydrolysing)